MDALLLQLSRSLCLPLLNVSIDLFDFIPGLPMASRQAKKLRVMLMKSDRSNIASSATYIAKHIGYWIMMSMLQGCMTVDYSRDQCRFFSIDKPTNLKLRQAYVWEALFVTNSFSEL